MKAMGVFSWNVVWSLDKNVSNILWAYFLSMFREKEGVIYFMVLWKTILYH